MKILTLFTLHCWAFIQPLSAAPRIIFSGTPETRIIDEVIKRSELVITKSEQVKYKVIITEDSGKYYWTTRENIELMRSQSGAYVTYSAANGSGYVRIEDSPTHQMLQKQVPGFRVDFKEHLQQGLASVTYYGISDK